MSEVKYRVCDIKKCENKAEKEQVKMQVKFHTDQTEGRNVKPYLSFETLDMCEECYNSVIKSGSYINAWGAMGHNTYELG